MILSARTITLYLFNKPFVRNISVSRLLRITDHYKTLELTASASQEDIKSAFFKLSKKFHPDLNKNTEESTRKFQEITAAYEILGNEKTRKEYDLDNVNLRVYRKSDIDEQIFRAKFYNSNLDPWDTGQNKSKSKKSSHKNESIQRKFPDEPEIDVTEKLKVSYRWIMYFVTICLSVIIGKTLPYFDLRTEFVEEQMRKQMEIKNDKDPNYPNRKVYYFFKYSG